MPAFGDSVRVRSTPETERLGLAGATGNITGFTTPSVTRVDVVGSTADDHAVAVHFGETGDRWFASDLLEVVDHGEGTVITIDGVNKKLIRNADGSWRAEAFVNPRKARIAWWKFW